MSSYTVVQNTSFLTAASILQKVISFLYFTFVARMVGVENTGQYFFALTFTTVFTVLADFGLGPVLTREASRRPNQAREFLHTVFWGKILFGVLTFLLVLLLVNLLRYPVGTKTLIYLSAVTMFFDNLQGAFYGIFRSRHNLIYESIGIVLSQLITMIIGTAALLLKAPLIWLIAAYAIPSFLNSIYAAFFVWRVYGFGFALVFNKEIFFQFLRLAFPFALAGFIGRLYSYADSIMMSKLLPAEALGWWSVPYKIIFAFQFVPTALAASVYPAVSGYFMAGKEKIGPLFCKSWRYLFLIVFPLSAGLFVLAAPIIIKLYSPNYLPSVPVLRVLSVSLIFAYLSIINGAVLNAINKQKSQTVLIAAALFVNIALNWYLLPKIGIMGAAWSALAGNILLWGIGFSLVSRFVMLDKIARARLTGQAARAAFPALIMGMAVWWSVGRVGLGFSVLVGILSYGALLFVFGAVSKTEIRENIKKFFKPSV